MSSLLFNIMLLLVWGRKNPQKKDCIIASEKTNNSFCILKFPIFDPSEREHFSELAIPLYLTRQTVLSKIIQNYTI